ncbi:MAG: hypothetical protein MJK11_00755 [Pseudomonadales bacterium]|nr:hypothetical protein [Pseudomonadales bacterium]
MSKSTATYCNVLAEVNSSKWEQIEGSSGLLEQLTLAIILQQGITLASLVLKPAPILQIWCQVSRYPEQIYIISGRLYDVAFQQWLESGHFASRPPGEVHGPFICEEDCLVLEVSFPSQSVSSS